LLLQDEKKFGDSARARIAALNQEIDQLRPGTRRQRAAARR